MPDALNRYDDLDTKEKNSVLTSKESKVKDSVDSRFGAALKDTDVIYYKYPNMTNKIEEWRGMGYTDSWIEDRIELFTYQATTEGYSQKEIDEHLGISEDSLRKYNTLKTLKRDNSVAEIANMGESEYAAAQESALKAGIDKGRLHNYLVTEESDRDKVKRFEEVYDALNNKDKFQKMYGSVVGVDKIKENIEKMPVSRRNKYERLALMTEEGRVAEAENILQMDDREEKMRVRSLGIDYLDYKKKEELQRKEVIIKALEKAVAPAKQLEEARLGGEVDTLDTAYNLAAKIDTVDKIFAPVAIGAKKFSSQLEAFPAYVTQYTNWDKAKEWANDFVTRESDEIKKAMEFHYGEEGATFAQNALEALGSMSAYMGVQGFLTFLTGSPKTSGVAVRTISDVGRTYKEVLERTDNAEEARLAAQKMWLVSMPMNIALGTIDVLDKYEWYRNIITNNIQSEAMRTFAWQSSARLANAALYSATSMAIGYGEERYIKGLESAEIEWQTLAVERGLSSALIGFATGASFKSFKSMVDTHVATQGAKNLAKKARDSEYANTEIKNKLSELKLGKEATSREAKLSQSILEAVADNTDSTTLAVAPSANNIGFTQLADLGSIPEVADTSSFTAPLSEFQYIVKKPFDFLQEKYSHLKYAIANTGKKFENNIDKAQANSLINLNNAARDAVGKTRSQIQSARKLTSMFAVLNKNAWENADPDSPLGIQAREFLQMVGLNAADEITENNFKDVIDVFAKSYMDFLNGRGETPTEAQVALFSSFSTFGDKIFNAVSDSGGKVSSHSELLNGKAIANLARNFRQRSLLESSGTPAHNDVIPSDKNFVDKDGNVKTPPKDVAATVAEDGTSVRTESGLTPSGEQTGRPLTSGSKGADMAEKTPKKVYRTPETSGRYDVEMSKSDRRMLWNDNKKARTALENKEKRGQFSTTPVDKNTTKSALRAISANQWNDHLNNREALLVARQAELLKLMKTAEGIGDTKLVVEFRNTLSKIEQEIGNISQARVDIADKLALMGKLAETGKITKAEMKKMGNLDVNEKALSRILGDESLDAINKEGKAYIKASKDIFTPFKTIGETYDAYQDLDAKLKALTLEREAHHLVGNQKAFVDVTEEYDQMASAITTIKNSVVKKLNEHKKIFRGFTKDTRNMNIHYDNRDDIVNILDVLTNSENVDAEKASGIRAMLSATLKEAAPDEDKLEFINRIEKDGVFGLKMHEVKNLKDVVDKIKESGIAKRAVVVKAHQDAVNVVKNDIYRNMSKRFKVSPESLDKLFKGDARAFNAELKRVPIEEREAIRSATHALLKAGLMESNKIDILDGHADFKGPLYRLLMTENTRRDNEVLSDLNVMNKQVRELVKKHQLKARNFGDEIHINNNGEIDFMPNPMKLLDLGRGKRSFITSEELPAMPLRKADHNFTRGQVMHIFALRETYPEMGKELERCNFIPIGVQDKLIEQLTPSEKAFAKDIIPLFEFGKERVAEVLGKVDNKKLRLQSEYLPVRRIREYAVAGTRNYKEILDRVPDGFTKEKFDKSDLPFGIYDLSSYLTFNVKERSNYIHKKEYANLILDALGENSNVRRALDLVYGKDTRVIDNIMKDVMSPFDLNFDDTMLEVFAQIRNNFSVSKLWGNLNVGRKQLTALIYSLAEAPAYDVSKAFIKVHASPVEYYKKAVSENPEISSSSITELITGAKDMTGRGWLSNFSKEAGLSHIKQADRWIKVIEHEALMSYAGRQGLEGQDALDFAREALSRINNTRNPAYEASAMRQPMLKTFRPFTNMTVKIWNMLVHTLPRHVKHERYGMAAQTVGTLAAPVIAERYWKYKKEDVEKFASYDLLADIALSMLTTEPITGGLISAGINYGGRAAASPQGDLFVKTALAVKESYKAITGEKEMDRMKMLFYTNNILSTVKTGHPTVALERIYNFIETKDPSAFFGRVPLQDNHPLDMAWLGTKRDKEELAKALEVKTIEEKRAERLRRMQEKRKGQANIDEVYPSSSGLIEKGNIDLDGRKKIKNKDGTFSTIKSMSVSFDDGVYLIPTISNSGIQMSEEDAIDTFKETGEHLGIFKTVKDADKYAKVLSKRQAKQ